MKTLRKYKGELRWFTELGARIATNDLLNEIRNCLKDYKALHVQVKKGNKQ